MVSLKMKGVIVRAVSRVLLRSRLVVLGLSLLLSRGTAGAASSGSLAEQVDALVSSPKIGNMRVGIQIVALDGRPQMVYEKNSRESLKPASNQKVLTTAAALALLPADFKFTTVLARRGKDLIVVGSGDPATGDPKLARDAKEPITAIFHEWADKLKAAGITRIEGDLLFDDYVFEQQHMNPSWADQFQDQIQNWYVAPVGGLNFNDNCVDVLVKPGAKIGGPAEVTLVPNTPYVQIVNSTKTASKGEPVIRRTGKDPVTVTVSGSVSRATDPRYATSLTIVDPGMFFASAMRTALAAKGIAIDGQTKRERVRLANGSLPGDLQIVARHEQTLPEILERCDRDSQNMFAEALLKAVGAYVGAENSPREGSYATGRQVIELFLKKLGLPSEGCVVDDGSGLSHSNRVTAAALNGVLVYMDRHPRQKEWISNLATPGGEGTLRKRMKELKGKMWGKTGHISGVSTLSGYVQGPKNRRYAFTILCNGSPPKGGLSAHSLQDAICRKLASWDGPLTSGAE